MRWLLPLLFVSLAACSGTRALQASKTVPYATLEQTVQVGHSNKAQVRAALGDSSSIRFDSGKEVWMYSYPSLSGADGEYVILFGADGMVQKVRSGEVYRVEK